MSGERVLLRARSGARVGLGHWMRTCAVAEEILARGGRALLVLDDVGGVERARARGLEAVSVLERPTWAQEPARAAWLDGFMDWTEELRCLARRRAPTVLVENRTPAREWCRRLVYPALHHEPDDWDRAHAERVLAGPDWIPLARAVRETPRPARRDVDVLITFGGSDPLRSTERVLAQLPVVGLEVVVSVGPHMAERRAAIEGAARARGARVLPIGAELGPWMARSRLAITALGTTLYELAYLGTPALILANYEQDRRALEFYARQGPHRPLGISAELPDADLKLVLAQGIAAGASSPVVIPGLGSGAARVAGLLLGASETALAA